MYIVDFASIVFPENLWHFQGMEAMRDSMEHPLIQSVVTWCHRLRLALNRDLWSLWRWINTRQAIEISELSLEFGIQLRFKQLKWFRRLRCSRACHVEVSVSRVANTSGSRAFAWHTFGSLSQWLGQAFSATRSRDVQSGSSHCGQGFAQRFPGWWLDQLTSRSVSCNMGFGSCEQSWTTWLFCKVACCFHFPAKSSKRKIPRNWFVRHFSKNTSCKNCEVMLVVLAISALRLSLQAWLIAVRFLPRWSRLACSFFKRCSYSTWHSAAKILKWCWMSGNL